MTLELTSISSLRETVAAWRAAGDSIALVPTMGALHSGHMALVKVARSQANRVIVSIFVNPTQFGPNEDFDRYPRPREKDLRMLREEGADAAWLPSVEEMYSDGVVSSIRAGSASEGLDGAARPGHFDGVATVVAKLLQHAAPDVALFGEKDYQQLCVIRQLVRDKNIPVRILGVPTVRESSGLALSSRNQYLSADERKVAPKIYATLMELAAQLKHSQAGIPAQLIEQTKQKILAAGFTRIDYLELRAEDTLAPIMKADKTARLLVAAWLGKTRLIDNVRVE